MKRPYRLLSFLSLTATAVAIVAAYAHPAFAAAVPPSQHQEKRVSKQAAGTLKLQELQIVDESGRVCMVLSAHDGASSIQMLGADGSALLSASLNKEGLGAVKIANPNKSGSVAAMEVDDKGAHVKFDRPGGASSYLFLNNEGVSGTVLIDAQGKRRLNIILRGDGSPEIQQFDATGKAIR